MCAARPAARGPKPQEVQCTMVMFMALVSGRRCAKASQELA
jgi:hypothetical protein